MVERAVNHIFQVAYVSTDFQNGLEIMKKQFGIRDFLIMNGMVVTLVDGRTVKMSIALTRVADMMYELITPEGGEDGLYRNALAREGCDFTFHHLGMMIDKREEYDRQLAGHAAAGNEIALDGLFAAKSRFFYARLADMGHYLEYVWLDETDRSFFDAVAHV
jgi:hypothetical protein